MVVVIEVSMCMFAVVYIVMGIVWMCMEISVLSSQLNKLSLEVILPKYMQTRFVYDLFWPSYSDALCENLNAVSAKF